MELWEKEYLEAIQRRKRTRGKATKGRINKCWEEVTCPDGSKWYVPKQEAFRKQEHKQRRQSRISEGMKKSGKVILILVLAMVFMFVLPSFKTLDPDSSTHFPRSFNMFHVHNTYVTELLLSHDDVQPIQPE